MRDDEPNDTPLYGVSLKAYAAVNAALGEGFSLERILIIERLPKHDFERADVKWRKRLEEERAKAPGGLAARYQAELVAAEDWLSRKVKPLEDDPAAWSIFFAAYSAAPDRARMLAKHALHVNDVTRLSRLWKRRAEKDPALGRKLAALPTTGEIPKITADPAVLKRARKGGASAAVEIEPPPMAPQNAPAEWTADSLDIQTFGLDRYASFVAELEVFPKEAARVRAKYDVATEADQTELARRFKAFVAESSDHEREYRRFYNLALDRARKVAANTTADERARAVSREEESHARPQEKILFQELSASKLPEPETSGIGQFYVPAVDLKPPPAAPEKPQGGATQDVAALLGDDPLPFVPEAGKFGGQEQVIKRAIAVAEKQQGPALEKPEAGGTQDVDDLLSGTALPAAWEDKNEPVVPEKPAAVKPPPQPVRPATPGPTGPPAPAAAAMPILPDLTLEQYASLRAELELHPERSRDALARYRVPPEAQPTLDAVWKQRLASDARMADAFAKATASYKTWLASQERKAPVAPPLNLEQYACLNVDLSRDPARRAETLQRYRIDEAARASLDAYYQQQFQVDPRARAAFDQATVAYRVWLAGRGR